MTLRLQNMMLAMLLALTTLFVGFGTLSQNPTSGGYQLFERAASGISADIQLASLGNFAPPLETVSEYANAPNRTVTDFIDGVTVVDRRTGTTFTGTVDLRPTLDRIDNGIPHPHRNNGSTFRNREGLLPSQPDGYYTEFVHPTPGVNGPGPQRIIRGQGGELYYTPDHYGSFIPLNQ